MEPLASAAPAQVTAPKGCQPNHWGARRSCRLKPLVFAFLRVFVTQEHIAARGAGRHSLHVGPVAQCKRTPLSCTMYCKLETIYRSAVAISGAAWMSGRACQPRAITTARTPFLTQLWTILHLTWWASLESTFQIFGKPFSHCPSQSWHFRQHDRKDVMSAAFQVVVTVVSTSSVIFAFLTIPHLEPCHK